MHYVDEFGQEEWIDSLFQTYIRAATTKIGKEIDWLVSVFSDNAGIIRFNDRYNIAYKVETHNSPSALDPYGGAITGIVGVNRDPMGTGMGCEMLANVWGYCLGSPFYSGRTARRINASESHPRRRASRSHRRREPERHSVCARLRAVRRALYREAAGVLRHSRPHPAAAAGPSFRAKRDFSRRCHRDVRRAHRQRRDPRGDVFFRRAAQRVACAGGPDRRPDYAAQDV